MVSHYQEIDMHVSPSCFVTRGLGCRGSVVEDKRQQPHFMLISSRELSRYYNKKPNLHSQYRYCCTIMSLYWAILRRFQSDESSEKVNKWDTDSRKNSTRFFELFSNTRDEFRLKILVRHFKFEYSHTTDIFVYFDHCTGLWDYLDTD